MSNKEPEGTPMSKFTEGASVYLTDGTKAEYVASTPAGHVVLVDLYVNDEYDDWSDKEPRVVSAVHAAPPVARIEQRIEELRATKESLGEEIAEMRATLASEEAAGKERVDSLRAWSGFKTLEAFVKGKITHIVDCGGFRGPRIKTLDDALRSDTRVDSRHLRLLSLFGRSNGDYEWMLNQYSDGSGGYSGVYPVASHDAAVSKIADLWAERVAAWREDKTKWSLVTSWIDAALGFGVSVPADVADAVHAKRVDGRERKVAAARDALTKAETDLRSMQQAEVAK